MSQPTSVVSSAILVLAFGALAGCGLLFDEQARFERARQAYADGDVNAAIVDLKALLQGNPDRIDARLLLGEALLRVQDVAGAEKEFESGVELLREAGAAGAAQRPDARRELVDASMKLAALQLALRDFESARANAELVVAEDPENEAAYVIASQSAYYTGDNAAARSFASRLLDRSPGNPLGHAMLGFVDAREGAFGPAESHFSAALVREPNHMPVRLALAQLQLVMQNHAAAIATLTPVLVAAPTNEQLHQLVDLMQLGVPVTRARVEELAHEVEVANPASPVPSMLRGRAAFLARGYEAAAEQFLAAMAKEGGRYPVIGRYLSQRALGDQAAAQQTLEQWMAANPADQGTGFLLASGYLEQGDNERARALYEQLVGTTEIDSPLVLNNLAWLYGEVNDPRAIETARQAHDLAPDSGAITDTLGWLLVRAKEYEEGIRLLRLAAEQAPDSEDIRYHLATALAEAGDLDAAERQIERVLRGPLDPGANLRPENAIGNGSVQ